MTAVPEYTDDDFLALFLGELPYGPVWPRDTDTRMWSVLGVLTPTYTRNAARTRDLLADVFPATTNELLPEWELSVGLPDPCSPLAGSVPARVAAVVSKLVGSTGQSIAYYLALAAALGFSIEIDEPASLSAGMAVGLPVSGPEWDFVWTITTATVPTWYFLAGESVAGDPLTMWGGDELTCRIKQTAPAHTLPTFVFT